MPGVLYRRDMKGLIILANGFEDTEAITTINILRRAKISLCVAALGRDLFVVSQAGLGLRAEVSLEDIDISDYGFLVLPGGKAVFEVLRHNKKVTDIIDDFVIAGKLIAAICAAPMLPGLRGHLKNHKYTCFPGCEKEITEGLYLPHKTVVKSGNFITAKAMGFTPQFAYEIVEYVLGKAERKIIEQKCAGEI